MGKKVIITCNLPEGTIVGKNSLNKKCYIKLKNTEGNEEMHEVKETDYNYYQVDDEIKSPNNYKAYAYLVLKRGQVNGCFFDRERAKRFGGDESAVIFEIQII